MVVTARSIHSAGGIRVSNVQVRFSLRFNIKYPDNLSKNTVTSASLELDEFARVLCLRYCKVTALTVAMRP